MTPVRMFPLILFRMSAREETQQGVIGDREQAEAEGEGHHLPERNLGGGTRKPKGDRDKDAEIHKDAADAPNQRSNE